jgi:hypothetical protein
MNKNVKKIIAREIIFLFCIIGSTIIAYVSTSVYNLYQIQKISTLDTQINNLSKSYKAKLDRQVWLLDKQREYLKIYYDQKEQEQTWKYLFNHVENDRLPIKMGFKVDNKIKPWSAEVINFLKQLGFDTPEKFKKFIVDSRFNKTELANYRLSKSISSEKQQLSKRILENYEKRDITIWTSIFSFIILFLLRYLMLVLRWSIYTLRN